MRGQAERPERTGQRDGGVEIQTSGRVDASAALRFVYAAASSETGLVQVLAHLEASLPAGNLPESFKFSRDIDFVILFLFNTCFCSWGSVAKISM